MIHGSEKVIAEQPEECLNCPRALAALKYLVLLELKKW
jgi:hypothetical protein